MNLREFAQQQEQERAGQDFKNPEPPPERQLTAPTDTAPIAAAQKIIAEHKLSHEIAEGCRLQILQDIERKENPYKLLLLAAEAIGRLDFKGDSFFLQVRDKLTQVHGFDISEADSSNWK
jgi:hypothetical protein